MNGAASTVNGRDVRPERVGVADQDRTGRSSRAPGVDMSDG